MADGTPNPFTLHEALPVEKGHTWVFAKWFLPRAATADRLAGETVGMQTCRDPYLSADQPFGLNPAHPCLC